MRVSPTEEVHRKLWSSTTLFCRTCVAKCETRETSRAECLHAGDACACVVDPKNKTNLRKQPVGWTTSLDDTMLSIGPRQVASGGSCVIRLQPTSAMARNTNRNSRKRKSAVVQLQKLMQESALSICLINTVPLHSLKYNSQRVGVSY